MKKVLSDFQKLVFGVPEEGDDFSWKEMSLFYGFLLFLTVIGSMGLLTR